MQWPSSKKYVLPLVALGVLSVIAIAVARRIYSPVLSTLPELDASVRGQLPNIILISIDTLRKSELGFYDPSLPTTPYLDTRRGEFIRFEQAISQAPWTKPAHLALFYSKRPPVHFWERDVVSITSVLRHYGYDTAAFTDGAWLGKGAGIDAGFNQFDRPDDPPFGFTFPLEGRVEQIGHWLDDGPSEPFFLFIHTYHTHAPYDPQPTHLESVYEKEYMGQFTGEAAQLLKSNQLKLSGISPNVRPEDIEYLRALYRAEIREVDEFLDRLFVELERRSLWDEVLVIITSDHGESFFEREFFEHGTGLYDELINVPLLIKTPASLATKAQVVDRQVELLDLGPTILDLIGIDPPETFQGRSFASLFSVGSSNAYSKRYALSSVASSKNYGDAKQSVRTEDWKYILHPSSGREELYHLATDPEEYHNLARVKPEIAASLRAVLRGTTETEDLELTAEENLSDKDLELLKALGYID